MRTQFGAKQRALVLASVLAVGAMPLLVYANAEDRSWREDCEARRASGEQFAYCEDWYWHRESLTQATAMTWAVATGVALGLFLAVGLRGFD